MQSSTLRKGWILCDVHSRIKQGCVLSVAMYLVVSCTGPVES